MTEPDLLPDSLGLDRDGGSPSLLAGGRDVDFAHLDLLPIFPGRSQVSLETERIGLEELSDELQVEDDAQEPLLVRPHEVSDQIRDLPSVYNDRRRVSGFGIVALPGQGKLAAATHLDCLEPGPLEFFGDLLAAPQAIGEIGKVTNRMPQSGSGCPEIGLVEGDLGCRLPVWLRTDRVDKNLRVLIRHG